MEFYRNKSTLSVVEAYQTQEQIEVEAENGKEIANPGDYVATNAYGCTYIYNDKDFHKQYIKVKEVAHE